MLDLTFDTNHTPAADPQPQTATALILDSWSIRKGHELHNSNPATRCCSPDAIADFRAAAYEPRPVLSDSPANEHRAEYLRELLASPEWQAMRQTTMFDDYASELAAEQAAREYAKIQPDDDSDALNLDTDQQLDMIRGVGRATKRASDDVGELRDAMAAIGEGEAPGGHAQPRREKLDPKRQRRLFERCKASTQLRKIMELAGKYRRLAQSRQSSKFDKGNEEVVGIEPGNDLARMTNNELLNAAVSLALFATRYATRQLQLIERATPVSESRGPIVVCVDESTSMNAPATRGDEDSGRRIEHAKAIALALAWVARSQNRYVAIHSFTDDPQGETIVLDPQNWKPEVMLNWLTGFMRGCTEMTSTMGHLPTQWEEIGAPKGKTDMVILTDGKCDVSPSLEASFTDWKKKENVDLFTALIDQDKTGCDIERLSDHVTPIKFDVSDEGLQSLFDV